MLLAGAGAFVWQIQFTGPGSSGHSMAPPDTSQGEQGASLAQVKLPANLSAEAQKTKAALLFVSHDASLAPLFDRAVDLSEINQAATAMRAA